MCLLPFLHLLNLFHLLLRPRSCCLLGWCPRPQWSSGLLILLLVWWRVRWVWRW
uniref:Uncharacterized protein n=1 Tax=Arundo donax TaxID=35708 RepID=A0A0A9AF27_ARUDO